MRLENFSIGIVQTEIMFGEPVPSAIVKSPIGEPWLIESDGPVGNERALHVDALFAYGRNQYTYWADRLTPTEPWPDGFFGENLTFEHLDESRLRLGEVYAIGDDVRVVVAGPRTPCWKVAWRLGQPMTILREMALSGHTGTYFSVQSPGRVRPGDELTLVEPQPDSPTIAEVADLCSSEEPPDPDAVTRTLDHPALSAMTRIVLGARLTLAQRMRERDDIAWRGWRRFRIAGRVDLGHDIVSYSLAPLGDDPLPVPRPGQYVSARFPGAPAPVVRSWSLSRHDESPSEYEITVKELPDGAGTTMLRESHRTGAELELRAPTGQFILDEGSFKPIILVAAGVGITPIRAMLQSHLRRGPGAPPLWLLHGSRSRTGAFRDELDDLARYHEHLHIRHFVTGPDQPEDDSLHHGGRITAPAIIDILTGNYLGPLDNPIRIPWYEAKFYLCGPDTFCTDIEQGLIKAGASSDHIHTEEFTPAGMRRDDLPVAPYAVVNFERSRITADWVAGEFASLLDLAEGSGIEVPSECRSGVCGTCRTPVLRGEANATDSAGVTFLCQATPITQDLALDL